MIMEMQSESKAIRSRTMAFYKTNYTKWVRIRFADIMYIDTVTKLAARIVFKDDKIVHSNETLTKISMVLPARFERIHRSCLVNIDYVEYVDYRKKRIVLKNKEQLKMGLAYMSNLEKYFI